MSKTIPYRTAALGGGLLAATLFAAPATVHASPVLYYNFDSDSMSAGGINDQSGQGNNGSVISARNLNSNFGGAPPAASFSTDVPSQIASRSSDSLNLSNNVLGSGYYVDSNTPVYKGIVAPLTFSMWVKLPTSGEDTAAVLFSEGTNNNGQKLELLLDTANNANGIPDPLRLGIQGAGIDLNAAGDISIADGNWHLINVVDPASGVALSTVKVYVDGVLQTIGAPGIGAAGGGTNNPSNTLSIVPSVDFGVGLGTAEGSGEPTSGLLIGKVDDVALFNTALSQSDISSLYAGTSPTLIGVPEPASLGALMVFGSVVGLRRRRSDRQC